MLFGGLGTFAEEDGTAVAPVLATLLRFPLKDALT